MLNEWQWLKVQIDVNEWGVVIYERRDGDAIIASAQLSDHDAYAAIQTLMRSVVMLACLYARDM